MNAASTGTVEKLLSDSRWSFLHSASLCHVTWNIMGRQRAVSQLQHEGSVAECCWRHGVERAGWRGNWLAWRAARDGGAATHSRLGGPTVNTELLWPSDRRSRRHLPFSFSPATSAHVRPSLLFSGVSTESRRVVELGGCYGTRARALPRVSVSSEVPARAPIIPPPSVPFRSPLYWLPSAL